MATSNKQLYKDGLLRSIQLGRKNKSVRSVINGHSASISLKSPIYNPVFIKEVVSILVLINNSLSGLSNLTKENSLRCDSTSLSKTYNKRKRNIPSKYPRPNLNKRNSFVNSRR